jgi:hypothetical protein
MQRCAFQFFMFEKRLVDRLPSLVKAIGDSRAAVLKDKAAMQDKGKLLIALTDLQEKQKAIIHADQAARVRAVESFLQP